MKKKSVIISVGAIVVIIAFALAISFVFSDNGKTPEDNVENSFNIEGTWVVVANYTNDIPVFVENQFMNFNKNEASMYKDTSDTPFAKSVYEINDSNQLILSDISREYKVAPKTDNCVRLYDTATTYMLLVRNSTQENKTSPVTESFLQGKWNVVLKAESLNNGEVMSFENNHLEYFKNSGDKPFSASDFIIKDDIISIDSLGLNMRCFKNDENNIIFVEESGVVWELAKCS